MANSQDFSDYADGFAPNIEIHEADSFEDMKPLGDANELLLRSAINYLLGKELPGRMDRKTPILFEPPKTHAFEDEMHLNGIR